MNAKQDNLTLWSAAAILAISAMASLLFAVAWPLSGEPVGAVNGATNPATHPTAVAVLPALSGFEKIWSLQLRRELGAPLPATSTPAVAAQPVDGSTTVPVTLVGTIGTSLAMLKTPSNSVEVRGVGESISGVTVIAVRPAEVDVRFNGQVVKLAKPREN